jgi:protein-disulfide isomerase
VPGGRPAGQAQRGGLVRAPRRIQSSGSLRPGCVGCTSTAAVAAVVVPTPMHTTTGLERSPAMSRKQSKGTRGSSSRRAAERVAELRAAQERDHRGRRSLIIGAAAAGVRVLVCRAGGGVQAGRDTTGEAATPSGGYRRHLRGSDGAGERPCDRHVYEDMLCAFCGLFEQLSPDRLEEYAASGDVQVRYHIVSSLHNQSSIYYSTRAAHAVAVVRDAAGAEAAIAFHDTLFDHQPEEGVWKSPTSSSSPTPSRQAPTGRRSRDRPRTWSCSSGWSMPPVSGPTAASTALPAVTVDGEAVEFTDAEELLVDTETAIDAALGPQ